MLGLVLRAATGAAARRLPVREDLAPMGAEADATWLIDQAGYEIGYCCLNATLRDWARLGLLLANYGAHATASRSSPPTG